MIVVFIDIIYVVFVGFDVKKNGIYIVFINDEYVNFLVFRIEDKDSEKIKVL